MAIGLNNDINNLGILNGTINSEFRNVIQNITNLSTGQNNGTTTSLYNNTQSLSNSTSQYRIICQGTITPKYSNSLIEVIGFLSGYADNTATTQMESLVYVHTASQGTIAGLASNPPSGTLIGKFIAGTSISSSGAGVGSFGVLAYTTSLIANTNYFITLISRSYNGSYAYVNISNGHFSSMAFKEYI